VIRVDAVRPYHQPRVVARVLDGETVIVDPEHNVVRLLNSVGSRIWELVDGTRTPSQVALVLADEYAVDTAHARRSVDAFIIELAAKQLLCMPEERENNG
jgi:hypothetical protein